MPPGQGFKKSWFDKFVSDPKLIFGCAGGGALVVLTILAFQTNMTASKQKAEGSEKLAPGQKATWKKSPSGGLLDPAESSIGVRKLMVKKDSLLSGSASRLEPVDPAASGTQDSLAKAGAVQDQTRQNVEDLTQQIMDSTNYVQDTGQGPGMGDISGLDNAGYAATGGIGAGAPAQGAPVAGQGETGPEEAPAMVQAGGRTIGGSGAGRSFMRRTGSGKVQGVGTPPRGGGGTHAMAPSGHGHATGHAGSIGHTGGGGGGFGAGGAGGSGGNVAAGGGGGRSGGGMSSAGGGGGSGGGGIGAGGGGGGGQAKANVKQKSAKKINQDAESYLSLANDYHAGVLKPIIAKEQKRVPDVRTKAGQSIDALESLDKTLQTAKLNYGGDALTAINDVQGLIRKEQLPRLRDGWEMLGGAMGGIGGILNGCRKGYYTNIWETQYYRLGTQNAYKYPSDPVVQYDGYWARAHKEQVQKWVPVKPGDALTAHRQMDVAFTQISHARGLAESFKPTVAGEFESIAAGMEDPVLAQKYRELKSEIVSTFGKVAALLPKGLGAVSGTDKIKSAAKTQHLKIAARDQKLKDDNLAYPQTGSLKKAQEYSAGAKTHAGDVVVGLNSAAESLRSFVHSGRSATEAYVDLCDCWVYLKRVAKNK